MCSNEMGDRHLPTTQIESKNVKTMTVLRVPAVTADHRVALVLIWRPKTSILSAPAAGTGLSLVES